MARRTLKSLVVGGLAAGALVALIGAPGAFADAEHGKGNGVTHNLTLADVNQTPSATATSVPSSTPTSTATSTVTASPTATLPVCPTATSTSTATSTATATAVSDGTATVTATATSTVEASPTATAVPCATVTPTATSTPVPTTTATVVPTSTGTVTATATVAATPTPQAGEDEDGEESLEHRHGISGIVTAVSGSATNGTLTVRTEDGLVATIRITADTELRGEGHDSVSFGEIAVGDRVNVNGEPTEAAGDATLVASRVIVHAAEHGRSDDQDDEHDNSDHGNSDHGNGRGNGNGRGR